MSISGMFKLRATFNHSSTINTGHYWAFIRDTDNSSWLMCNDTSAAKASVKDLSNDSLYILNDSLYILIYSNVWFIPLQLDCVKFVASFLQWDLTSWSLLLECDDPTYNPSPVGGSSLLTSTHRY